jgi:hypothetical protein
MRRLHGLLVCDVREEDGMKTFEVIKWGILDVRNCKSQSLVETTIGNVWVWIDNYYLSMYRAKESWYEHGFHYRVPLRVIYELEEQIMESLCLEFYDRAEIVAARPDCNQNVPAVVLQMCKATAAANKGW